MSRLYVIVRDDLQTLNPGKAMAQVNHAGTQFVSSFARDSGIKHKLVREWLNEADGFGTVVVLSGKIEDIRALCVTMSLMEKPNKMIKDPTYPFLLDKETVQLLINSKVMDELKTNCDFQYSEEDMNDPETTKVHCTRIEETCAWFFIDDESIDEFKGYCDSANIQLHV